MAARDPLLLRTIIYDMAESLLSPSRRLTTILPLNKLFSLDIRSFLYDILVYLSRPEFEFGTIFSFFRRIDIPLLRWPLPPSRITAPLSVLFSMDELSFAASAASGPPLQWFVPGPFLAMVFKISDSPFPDLLRNDLVHLNDLVNSFMFNNQCPPYASALSGTNRDYSVIRSAEELALSTYLRLAVGG